MYIKSIIVKNFRTLQKERANFSMEFDSKFQIIAGANNSGKTNLLRALNLFFNGVTDEKRTYSREKDLPFHKSKYGTGSPVCTEIEVDLFLADEDVKKISNLKPFIINENIIKTKYVYKENESRWYYANTDGRFPPGLDKNIIELTDPIAILFRRIKFIFIPTHVDLGERINMLVADEILPSMVDGYGDSGLSQKIKQLRTDIDNIDILIKDIMKEKNVLMSEKFQEIIKEFPEIISDIPIKEFALEVALKDDNLTSIVSKRIELLVRDSSHNTIDSKGSGIQKVALITLLEYFSQNIVEKARYTNPFLIWAIDEPESFLQPKLQKKLREIFRRISNTHQIIISTHSPNLINIYNPSNVKLFYLETEAIDVKRKNRIIFKKETNYLDDKSSLFIDKLKEHLGIEMNDGWILQNKNFLFEGNDDITYFHSTFKAMMGYSFPSSNISCESVNNMPSFIELINNKIADKQIKKGSLFCLVDNDTAGRNIYKKIKPKKYLKTIKTISLYLSSADNKIDNYPSMIEDLVIPELFFEAIISFLSKRISKTKLKKFNISTFVSERKKAKRTPMPEFLDNYFDSAIRLLNFSFKFLDIKFGISLEYSEIISRKTKKELESYSEKYPELITFLSQFK